MKKRHSKGQQPKGHQPRPPARRAEPGAPIQQPMTMQQMMMQQAEFLKAVEQGLIQHFNAMLENLSVNIPQFINDAVHQTLVEILTLEPEALEADLKHKAEIIEQHMHTVTVDLERKMRLRLDQISAGVPLSPGESQLTLPGVMPGGDEESAAARLARYREAAYGEQKPEGAPIGASADVRSPSGGNADASAVEPTTETTKEPEP